MNSLSSQHAAQVSQFQYVEGVTKGMKRSFFQKSKVTVKTDSHFQLKINIEMMPKYRRFVTIKL